MFKKLFGSSAAAQQKPQQQEAPNTEQAIKKLEDSIDILKKRAIKVENDMKTKIQEALQKNKLKDKRGKNWMHSLLPTAHDILSKNEI